MKYSELKLRPAYITAFIQMKLYDKVKEYLKHNKMSRTDFAKHLGVSKGYVTQLLSGEYDHKLSKLVELSLKIGYVPEIIYKPTLSSYESYDANITKVIHDLSSSIDCIAYLTAKSENVEMPKCIIKPPKFPQAI